MISWLHRSGISGWWNDFGYFAVTPRCAPRCASSSERVFSSPRCALALSNVIYINKYIFVSYLSSYRGLHYPTIVSSTSEPSTLRRDPQTSSNTSNAASPMMWSPSGRHIVTFAREDRVHADQSFAAAGAMIETLQKR